MKKIFLFIFLSFICSMAFGQINVFVDELSTENDYDCALVEQPSWGTYALCKKGGISSGGVNMYSKMYSSAWGTVFADAGFGFCEYNCYTYDGLDYNFVVLDRIVNKYAFMHSSGQNLVLVRITDGEIAKVLDLGVYNSVLSIRLDLSQQYCNVIATTPEGGTNILGFTIESSKLNALEPIVVNVNVSSITLNQSSVSIDKGSSIQLEATVLPEIATNKEIEWTSSDTSIATVADGLVTGVNAGMAIISAKATDGSNVMAQCIAVVQETSGVASVSIVDGVEGVYTTDGKQVSTMTSGTYVVRMTDGTTKKIQVK